MSLISKSTLSKMRNMEIPPYKPRSSVKKSKLILAEIPPYKPSKKFTPRRISLQSLPREILINIVEHAGPHQIAGLCASNKEFHDFCKANKDFICYTLLNKFYQIKLNEDIKHMACVLYEAVTDGNSRNISTIFHRVLANLDSFNASIDSLIRLLKDLLDNGANINRGHSPIDLALRKRPSLKLIRFLVEKGAIVDTMDIYYARQITGNRSPIHEFLFRSFHARWNPTMTNETIIQLFNQ